MVPNAGAMSKDYWSWMRKVWDATDLLNGGSAVGEEIESIVFDHVRCGVGASGAAEKSAADKTALQLPSAALVQSFSLAAAWMDRCPPGKARWNRLRKELWSLASDLETAAGGLEKEQDSSPCGNDAESRSHEVPSSARPSDDIGQSFAAAFSSATSPSSRGGGQGKTSAGGSESGSMVAATFYREGAAFLVLNVASADAARPGQGKSGNSSSEWTQKVCDLIPLGESNDMGRIVSAASVVSAAILLQRKLMSGCGDEQKKHIQEDSNRLFSRLASLLSGASGNLRETIDRERIQDRVVGGTNGASNDSAMTALGVGHIASLATSMIIRVSSLPSVGEIDAPKTDPHVSSVCGEVFSTIMPLISGVLASVTRATELGPSGELCFRSCLSLLRGAARLVHAMNPRDGHLRHSATPLLQQERSNPPSADRNYEVVRKELTLNLTPGDKDFDPFGGIDDDALMEIDLDICGREPQQVQVQHAHQNNPTQRTKVRKQIDQLVNGDIGPFLLKALSQSGPHASIRYALTPMSSYGKEVCHKHSLGICATLAALISLLTKDDIVAGSGPLSKWIWTADLQIVYMTSDSDDDVQMLTYSRQVRQSLIVELCRLSSFYSSCNTLLECGSTTALGHFLQALVDLETIKEFPSRSLGLMLKKGGKESREREQELLYRVNNCARGAEGKDVDPDCMARGLRNITDGFNTIGPSFMCRQFWSFAKRLGQAFSASNGPKPTAIKVIGELLQQVNSLFHEHHHQGSNQHGQSVDCECMERELLKRFVVIRKLVVILQEEGAFNSSEMGLEVPDLTCLAANAVLEQLYFTSFSMEYYHDAEASYDRAKAHAFHKAYAEFSGAVLVVLMREIKLSRTLDLFQPIQDDIVAPCIRSSNDAPIYLSVGKGAVRNSVIFQVKAGRNIYRSKPLSPFSKGLHRRVNELVVYSTRSVPLAEAKGRICTLYSALMEMTLSVGPGKGCHSLSPAAVIGRALHLPGMPSTGKGSWLQKTFDFEFSRDPYCDRLEHLKLSNMRKYAMQNFILPKLCLPSIREEWKLEILLIVENMLKTPKIHRGCTPADFITPYPHNTGFLSIQEDIVKVVKGLNLLVRNEIALGNLDLIGNIFSCVKLLLNFPIKDNPLDQSCTVQSILEWAMPRTHDNTYASYLYEFSKWTVCIGSILKNSNTVITVSEIFSSTVSQSDASVHDQLRGMQDTTARLDKCEQKIFPEVGKEKLNMYTKTPVNKYLKKPMQELIGSTSTASASSITMECLQRVEELIALCLAAYKKFNNARQAIEVKL
uniref:Uncharacterized protein n=1 Tax=Odontella aurita TaxID=265563 RepID=A0A7S4J733_9STRA